MKGLPFEFVMTSQNKAAKTAEFLRTVNPRGTIPSMEDDGLVLWESHAILVYLCEKNGWTDLWPDDLMLRAKVNQYLHFHHRNTREVVIGWSRALWPSVFGVDNPDAAWLKRNTFPGLQNNARVVQETLGIVEGMLTESPFLAGERATLADVSAYEELGQNQAKYANCTDYSSFPSIERWLVRMGGLPEHDKAHRIWELIGDVNKVSGGMSTIAAANKTAAKEWF